MGNRALTTIVLRFAALLLFMEVFEFFNSYFLSVFYTAAIPFMEEHLHTSIDKVYYNGVFLITANFLLSSILFFKADWIASKLIRQDSEIEIGLTPKKLIEAILLTTGVIWLARSIYILPDLYDYIQKTIAGINHVEFTKKVTFDPAIYVLKIIIGILFVFRVDKISLYLEKKMTKAESILRQGSNVS